MITLKEAMKRELAYREEMKKRSTIGGHNNASCFLPATSQGLPKIPDISNMKGKEAQSAGHPQNLLKTDDKSLPQLARLKSEFPQKLNTDHVNGQEIAAQALGSQKFPSTNAECQRPGSVAPPQIPQRATAAQFHKFGDQNRMKLGRQQQIFKPSLPELKRKKPLTPMGQQPQQILKYKQQIKKQSQDWHHVARDSLQAKQSMLQNNYIDYMASLSTQPSYLWCDICKVPCMNSFNFSQHLQGKNHKKLEMASEDNGVKGQVEYLWCHECNIPCMNKFSLDQHCLGKKHVANLLKMRAENLETVKPN